MQHIKINAILFFAIAFYLLIRVLCITPVFSDETIYINMAKALKEGLLPYRDFFFAHPPIQLLLLFPFATFGNFVLVKIFISIVGMTCIFLVFLISKELFDEKSALVSSIAFLIFPGFLIFGNLAMGSFETLFFFLLSFYCILRKKIVFSCIFLTLAIFTRYLALLLIPFLFIYILKFQRKDLKRFSFLSIFLIFFAFLLLYFLFGFSLIKFTILYQFQTNIEIAAQLSSLIWQYLSLGFFTFFISLFCLAFSYFKKDSKLFLFSSYPLFQDMAILLILRQVVYHYFVLSLPFIFIAFGRVFSKSKLLMTKTFLLAILLLCITSNLKSVSYYFDKTKNLIFDELLDYTLKFTKESDLIFGEPISTNYISFVTNRKIAGNYFDSDLKHISFESTEKVVNEIEKAKPKLIIVSKTYYSNFYSSFEKDYEIIKEWSAPEYYHLILMKIKE
jgi:4-amino-4-deoxy-L-arabinose transferase-like glycosyltransferase